MRAELKIRSRFVKKGRCGMIVFLCFTALREKEGRNENAAPGGYVGEKTFLRRPNKMASHYWEMTRKKRKKLKVETV